MIKITEEMQQRVDKAFEEKNIASGLPRPTTAFPI
jgi:hypothetical protein